MKQEIITYLAGPRNFIQGVELYEKYGINRMLKKSFRRQGETETMKAILLEELRKLAGLSEREFKTIRRNSKQPTAVKMEPVPDIVKHLINRLLFLRFTICGQRYVLCGTGHLCTLLPTGCHMQNEPCGQCSLPDSTLLIRCTKINLPGINSPGGLL